MNIDVASVVVGAIGGFISGVTVARTLRYGEASGRAMRLVPNVMYESRSPIVLAVVHRERRWRMMTARFCALCESLAPKSKRLPGRVRLAQATGETWRTFKPYLDLMATPVEVRLGEYQAMIEYVGGGRSAVWVARTKAQRRAMIAHLPFPTDRNPPDFKFTRS